MPQGVRFLAQQQKPLTTTPPAPKPANTQATAVRHANTVLSLSLSRRGTMLLQMKEALATQQKQMEDAMKNLTPERRKMLEQMMKKQGGGGR